MGVTIRVLKKGDKVLSITSDFIAIERKNGEVDILPLMNDGKTLRIDMESITTIGYGDNTVEAVTDGVTVTTF